MNLERILERCRRLEERAAALYRSYAASARAEPALCALWTALAREEEAHARSIAYARANLSAPEARLTRVDGWEDALDDVEHLLAVGEGLGSEATTADRLSAALDLEMSELEALRHVLVAACHRPEDDASDVHAVRLAQAATRFSDNPHVRLQAALLLARVRIAETVAQAGMM